MKLDNAMRQGIQAALSVGIAGVIALVFGIAHPQWVVISAGLLISMTWSQSLERALYRLGGTFLGCLVGVAISLFVPWEGVKMTLMLGSFCLATYYLRVSLAKAPFFISITVVVAYQAFGGILALDVLVLRVLDTAIGCFIAVVTSLLVLPIHSKKLVRGHLKSLLEHFKQLMEDYYWEALEGSGPSGSKFFTNYRVFSDDYQKTREAIRHSRYEIFFSRFPQNQIDELMLAMKSLVHTLFNFLYILRRVQGSRLSKILKPELETLQIYFVNHLTITIELCEGGKRGNKTDIPDWEALKRQLLQKLEVLWEEGEITVQETKHINAIVYYAHLLYEALDNFRSASNLSSG